MFNYENINLFYNFYNLNTTLSFKFKISSIFGKHQD